MTEHTGDGVLPRYSPAGWNDLISEFGSVYANPESFRAAGDIQQLNPYQAPFDPKGEDNWYPF
jgi:hypothetical protein